MRTCAASSLATHIDHSETEPEIAPRVHSEITFVTARMCVPHQHSAHSFRGTHSRSGRRDQRAPAVGLIYELVTIFTIAGAHTYAAYAVVTHPSRAVVVLMNLSCANTLRRFVHHRSELNSINILYAIVVRLRANGLSGKYIYAVLVRSIAAGRIAHTPGTNTQT